LLHGAWFFRTYAFWLNKDYSLALVRELTFFVVRSKFIQTWWSVFTPLIAEKHCEKPWRLPKNTYLIVFKSWGDMYLREEKTKSSPKVLLKETS